MEEEAITFRTFSLPAPTPLDPGEKMEIVDQAVQRIWQNGSELSTQPSITTPSDGLRMVVQPNEMWMLLLARLGTRGGEDKRKMISEFVTGDFASR